MNLLGKILISLFVAAVAYAGAAFIPAMPLWLLFAAATIATAMLVSLQPGSTSSDNRESSSDAAPAANNGQRESGEVKWFNVSKGFGFITKDNGDEIFVHFRSIRGEGRRGLRDGQRVTFVTVQSDKGPQAEDVEAL